MWLRLSEELYLPYGELVGFFSPKAVDAQHEGKTRSVVLLRDGRAIPSATGLKTLEKKFLLSFRTVKRK
jgi:hypothetical protein